MTLWGDRAAVFLLVIGLLASGSGFVYIWWFYDSLPETVPLHFNTDGSVDRIGEKLQLFLMPSIAVLVLFFNTSLAAFIYQRERVAARLLTAVGAGVGLMFLAGAINVVRLAFEF